jgi:type I restriction enzyme S subunit
MYLETFFENLNLLCEAPNSIEKLRELILQLAVMGKLVPQDPNDELASVLLEKIKAEKRKLSIKENPLPLIENKETPFGIPQSWEWVRLGEVINYNGAQKISSGDLPDDAWILDLEDIEKNTSKILNRAHFKDKKSKSTKAEFKKGNVLYGKLRPYLNKVVVADEDGYCTTEIVPLSIYTDIDPYYLMYTLKRPDFLEYVNSKTYGTKMPRLGTEDARKSLLPLPPLTEQKRIVSKVDELMVLCDKLEARRQKKQELQSKLNSAALDRMLSAENQEEFEQYWQRICENFDLLYDNPENVGKLKQAILQLAVQGKLVEQNPEDEPASVLIEKIEMEKKKLLNEGKIQKAKNSQAVDVEEIPYNIPNGWLWIRFGNIAPHIEAGWSPMCEKRPKEGEEWGVLKISAVSWNVFNPSENKALPSNLNPRPEYEVKPNDFLMSRANTSELVGKSVIVEETTPKLMISDKVLRLFFSSFASHKFYNLFNNSQTARFYYAKEASGTSSSMKNISREVIYNMPVPLPPLNEQKRIVEKVEQLMGLCDELEAKLRKSREDSEKLMEMVVRGLLEGAVAEI